MEKDKEALHERIATIGARIVREWGPGHAHLVVANEVLKRDPSIREDLRRLHRRNFDSRACIVGVIAGGTTRPGGNCDR